MKRLEALLGSKTNIAVLRGLCIAHHCDLTVTELAREAGVDKSAVSKALLSLESMGVVTASRRGNLKLCRINKSCRYYDMLEKLFIEESYIEHAEDGV